LIGDCLPESRRKRTNYSMLRVAGNKVVGGRLSLSSLADFASITKSNFAGNSTGKSPGFTPFNSLST